MVSCNKNSDERTESHNAKILTETKIVTTTLVIIYTMTENSNVNSNIDDNRKQ